MHSCLLLYPSGQPLIPRCCLNRTLFCLDCAFAITHEMKLWEDQVSGLLLNCRLSLAPGRVPPLCQLCTPSSAAKICLRVDPKWPGGDFPGAQVIRPLLFHSGQGRGLFPSGPLDSECGLGSSLSLQCLLLPGWSAPRYLHLWAQL